MTWNILQRMYRPGKNKFMYNVLIRPLKIEDALISYRWRNDSEIWQYTGKRPDKLITKEIEKDWLAEKLHETNSSRFAIIADDQYVGNIQITDIVKSDKGQYHIFIGEKVFWNKGIAQQATAQIIRFANEKLNLKEIYLIVNPNNVTAIKLYEKSGFHKVNDEIKMSINPFDAKQPIVSVFVMTFNHEKFIVQAFEGILMQKTNFDYNIVIGEDCSTDNTRKIVLEYAEKYPGKFKFLIHEQNIGAVANQIATLNACTGKYIAICEGDDYWTDSYKLQKQVDFLESYPNYAIVHTNKAVLLNNKLHADNSLQIKSGFIFEDLMFVPLICTLTVLGKADILKDSMARVSLRMENRKWLMGDFPLWLDIAQNYQIAYLSDITGVYRFLDESTSHSKNLVKAYNFEHSVINIKEYYYKIYIKSNKNISLGFILRFSEMIFHARKRLVIDYGWKAKSELVDIIFTNPFLYLYYLYNKILRILKIE